jgi:hypothetical protein
MEITKNKIHRLGFRFSIYFKSIPKAMVILEMTNIWQKSQDFCFVDSFLEILKIIRVDFLMDFWLF